MGKNKRSQLTFDDKIHNVTLSVDSQEEIDTLNWLSEAYALSVINDFEYQPKSFLLFDQQKYVDIDGKTRTLFREHEYTADFMIDITPSANLKLAKELKVPYEALSCQNYKVYIDSKGTFNKTERAFGYNQKWLWQKFKIYVYKLVPKKFFKLFGCPKESQFTQKTKKQRSLFIGCKSLKELFS